MTKSKNSVNYLKAQQSITVLKVKQIALLLVLVGFLTLSLPYAQWIKIFARRFNRSGYVGQGRPTDEVVLWTPCDDIIFCSRVSVPLDYHNASSGTVSLSLAKYPATSPSTRLGTLFVNPGGPGGSGVQFIYGAGKSVSHIVGGRYDIVGWDPRGINGSTPNIACFKSQTAQTLFSLNVRSADTRNLSDPADLASYKAEKAKLDALAAVSAQLCYEESGSGVLDHIGTTAVARDLERLSSVLEGPDVPINIWGFSYGTAIGNYFVNMFPDRVGRIVLDGNIDPEMWVSTPVSDWDKYDFADAEKTLQGFYKHCAKVGPERCALATTSSTAESLAKEVDDLFDKLYASPLPVPHGAKRPGILTVAIAIARLYYAMYDISSWPTLASDLRAAMTGNGAPILSVVQAPMTFNVSEPPRSEYAIVAVECIDAPPYNEFDLDDIRRHQIEQDMLTQTVTPHFVGVHNGVCHHWKTRSSERFVGPWNRTLSNPILVIGNTADPTTPLVNAVNTNRRLGNSSRLIVQNSYGHCSIATASTCTAKAIRAYFEDNILPPDGLVCEPSEMPFPKTKTQWMPNDVLLEEDVELLNAVNDVGAKVIEHASRGLQSVMFG